MQRASSSQFEGIYVDNGSPKSTAGFTAYKRYSSLFNTTPNISKGREDIFKLGNALHNSTGKSCIRMPIDADNNFIEYMNYVIDRDIPILFGPW